MYSMHTNLYAVKLCTLVTAMTLQRLPIKEAMSAFEIPQNEAKLICQDPWVSIAVTLITILGVAVYLYRACSKMTFFKGYMIILAPYICFSAMNAIMYQ